MLLSVVFLSSFCSSLGYRQPAPVVLINDLSMFFMTGFVVVIVVLSPYPVYFIVAKKIQEIG